MNQFIIFFSFLFPLTIMWIPHRMKSQAPIAMVLRRTILLLPYLFWLKNLNFYNPVFSLFHIIVLVLTVLLLLTWELKAFRFKSSKTYAVLCGPLNIFQAFGRLSNILIVVIAEESFFRLGILSVFDGKWGVILQSIAFVAAHRLTPWGNNFTRNDLTRQLIFSASAGYYFLETRDLLTCIITHLLLNISEITHLTQRVRRKNFSTEVFNGSF